MPYAKQTDFTDNDNVIYAGKAQVGSSTNSPVWSISKTTIVNDDISVQWAEGTALFDKVWNDRLTYTYA